MLSLVVTFRRVRGGTTRVMEAGAAGSSSSS
eukprot:COSAG01_NODE_56918_length_315_cov_1.175926_1_plen_30_part_01